MRTIQRTIVSAIIFSKDGKILMGKKDPSKGGVFPNAWHIPGGGIKEGETMEQTLIREIKEEVGLDVTNYPKVRIPIIGKGASEKTLEGTGEKVWCEMEFNRFEVHIDDQNANDIKLHLSDDLVEAKWFNKEALSKVEQIPGGKEFFEEMGYMQKK